MTLDHDDRSLYFIWPPWEGLAIPFHSGPETPVPFLQSAPAFPPTLRVLGEAAPSGLRHGTEHGSPHPAPRPHTRPLALSPTRVSPWAPAGRQNLLSSCSPGAPAAAGPGARGGGGRGEVDGPSKPSCCSNARTCSRSPQSGIWASLIQTRALGSAVTRSGCRVADPGVGCWQAGRAEPGVVPEGKRWAGWVRTELLSRKK